MTLINLTGSEERPPQASGSLLGSAAVYKPDLHMALCGKPDKD